MRLTDRPERWLRAFAVAAVVATTVAATFADVVGTPPDSVADVVYGQPGFSTNTLNTGGLSANSLWTPSGVILDRDSNLYVADNGNSRILFYAAGATTASRVYGQSGSFTTNFGNKGGLSANSLLFPEGITLDRNGNLYVADRNNNRVLFYLAGSTTATRVYGQGGNFTTNSTNGGTLPPTINQLFAPYDLVTDSDGNLYVADTGNHRVLYYAAGETTPSRVYGQLGDYNTGAPNKGGRSENTFSVPRGLALDSAGNLYVADQNNHRVLVFSPGSTTASRVYGQNGDFTTATGGTTPERFGAPEGVALDRNDNLYVADTGNSRILFFPSGSTTATHVYGQDGSFTTGTPNNNGVSEESLSHPKTVALDRAGNLFTSDRFNSRVLKFERPPDTVPPTAIPVQSPSANGAGWNNSDVSVIWNWDDDEAGTGVDEDNCVETSTSFDESDAIPLEATCFDYAGNKAEASYAVKVDKTAPTITAAPTSTPNGAGWYHAAVTIAFTCADDRSGVGACPTDEILTMEGAAVTSSAPVAIDAAGNTSAPSNVVTVNIDKTPPTITAAPTMSPNGAGWYKTPVTVAFTCLDALSGVASCPPEQTLGAEGSAVTSSAETATDAAGNVSAASNVVVVKIDKTSPMVVLNGGPANGGTYTVGSVPAAPTCSAFDALSGLAGNCTISGYTTSLGTHTVTALVSDVAGNQGAASAIYTVRALTSTILGFYQPVDMDGVWNIVKAGSTVPLKFELFVGSTEVTDPSAVLQPLTATQTVCGAGASDEVDLLASGATSLRYDASEGVFIYNWQTPKKPGYCYVVSVTSADGATLRANFQLK